MLASGEHLSRKFRVQNHSPLMYEWYQEQYVGAAHGLAGIYYYLMQVNRAGAGPIGGSVSLLLILCKRCKISRGEKMTHVMTFLLSFL